MSESSAIPAATVTKPIDGWLARFTIPDEERAFRDHYSAATLATTRIALIAALALTAAITVLDWLFMPGYYVAKTAPLRIAAVLLPLGFALGTSYVPDARAMFDKIVAIAVTLAGVATVAVGAIGVRYEVGFELLAAMLATSFAYLAVGLRRQPAAIAGGSIFLAYVGLGLAVSTSMQDFVYSCLMLALANAIGIYAGQRFETNARDLYTQGRELERLSRSDNLTGMPDRYTFHQHLTNIWRQARRDKRSVAAVLIDVDHFRLFNEYYGQADGDRCLQRLADLLGERVRRPLDLVARYGGKEFSIALYDPTEEFVQQLVDALCERVFSLEIPHNASEGSAVVTASIGAAVVRPEEGGGPEQLLRSADDALYEAKVRGRNQAVVYNPEWLDASRTRVPGIAL